MDGFQTLLLKNPSVLAFLDNFYKASQRAAANSFAIKDEMILEIKATLHLKNLRLICVLGDGKPL